MLTFPFYPKFYDKGPSPPRKSTLGHSVTTRFYPGSEWAHKKQHTYVHTCQKKPLLIQGSPGNVQENKVHVSDDQVKMTDLENVCFTMSTRRRRRYKQLPNLTQKKATPFSFPVGQRSHSCSVKLPLATQCLTGLKYAACVRTSLNFSPYLKWRSIFYNSGLSKMLKLLFLVEWKATIACSKWLLLADCYLLVSNFFYFSFSFLG